MESKHGNFAAPTTLGGTEVLTFPFDLKVLKLHGCRSNATTNATATGVDGFWGWGWATSPTSRYSVCAQDDDGPTTMATDSSDRDDCPLHSLDITGATVGRLDIQSWVFSAGVTTVTLVADAAFALAHRVFYLGWGGTGVEAAITQHTEPGSTGNHAETVGLADADLYLFTGAHQTASLPSSAPNAHLFFGACDKDGGSAVWCGGCEDAQANSDTACYARSGQVIAMMPADPNSLNARASFVSRSGTSLTLNWAERASNRRYAILAIKGLAAKVTAMTAALNASVGTSITGLSFRPTSGLFFGHLFVENADDTTRNRIDLTMGAYSNNVMAGANGDGGTWGIRSTDNSGTSNVSHGCRPLTDDIAATSVFDVLVEVSAIQDDGLDFALDDPNGTTSVFLPCVLVGSLATPVAQSGLCAAEWLAGASAGRAPPGEWIRGVAQGRSLPGEWMAGLSPSRVIGMEVLNPLSVTAARIVPAEWLAGRLVSLPVPSERLAGVVAARILPMEHEAQIASVLRSVIVEAEWRSGRVRSALIDVERLRRVLRGVAPGLEWSSLIVEIAPELIGICLSASRFAGLSRSGSHAVLRYFSGSTYSHVPALEEVVG